MPPSAEAEHQGVNSALPPLPWLPPPGSGQDASKLTSAGLDTTTAD
jgi:hypothetical protein